MSCPSLNYYPLQLKIDETFLFEPANFNLSSSSVSFSMDFQSLSGCFPLELNRNRRTIEFWCKQDHISVTNSKDMESGNQDTPSQSNHKRLCVLVESFSSTCSLCRKMWNFPWNLLRILWLLLALLTVSNNVDIDLNSNTVPFRTKEIFTNFYLIKLRICLQ